MNKKYNIPTPLDFASLNIACDKFDEVNAQLKELILKFEAYRDIIHTIRWRAKEAAQHAEECCDAVEDYKHPEAKLLADFHSKMTVIEVLSSERKEEFATLHNPEVLDNLLIELQQKVLDNIYAINNLPYTKRVDNTQS